MKRMFGGPMRPFYKAALNMKIGKPPRAESEEFLISRFEAEGISIRPEEINRIIEVSENIPYYLQAIAGLAFAGSSVGGARNFKMTMLITR